MTVNAKEILSQLAILRLRAEALVTDVKLLELTFRGAIIPEIPVGPVSGPVDATTGCACPIALRVACATSGHPTRTVCRQCKKEHES